MTSVLIRSTVARNVGTCCGCCCPATTPPASATMTTKGSVSCCTVCTPFGRPARPFGWRRKDTKDQPLHVVHSAVFFGSPAQRDEAEEAGAKEAVRGKGNRSLAISRGDAVGDELSITRFHSRDTGTHSASSVQRPPTCAWRCRKSHTPS